jgi:HK97 family phage major capsid protein
MTDLSAIRNAVTEMAKAQQAGDERRAQEIKTISEAVVAIGQRVEDLETRASRPPKAAPASPAFKSYETRNGTVYDVPSTTALSDVIPAVKSAPVSFDRWLAAFAAGERCEDRAALEFARDQKGLITATSGALIPQEYQSAWVDKIREQSVLTAAGMGVITMNGKTFNASAIASDPTASWHSEAGSISASSPTFEARSMTAETLVTRVQASVEIAQDSPDFARQLSAVMAGAMAAEVDRVGLHGSGTSPEPAGIYNTANVQTITGAGTSDYSALIAGTRKLLDQNLTLAEATRDIILPPRIWELYELAPTGLSGDNTQLPRPRSLQNARFHVTRHASTTTESPTLNVGFMGRFSDLALGVRMDASIEVLKLTTFASNLQLEFVGYLRCDYLVRRPASFVTIDFTATQQGGVLEGARARRPRPDRRIVGPRILLDDAIRHARHPPMGRGPSPTRCRRRHPTPARRGHNERAR